MPDDARIDVARSGAHHEPLERRESHRRVDRAAVLDRRGRATASEMQGDDRRGRLGPARQGAVAGEYRAIRDAVEAESADAVTIGELTRDRVAPRALRQRGVKRGIED